MEKTPLVSQIKILEESIVSLQVQKKTLTQTGKARRNRKKKIDLNLKRKNERLKVLREQLANGAVSEQTLDSEVIQESGGSGKLKVLQQVNPAHSDPVCGLCFLPNGQIASACEDNSVNIWSIETQDCVAILDHESPVRCVASLPGSRIATGTDEGTLTLWDLTKPNEPVAQEALDSPITCLVSVSGPALLVGLESGHVLEFLVRKAAFKKLKDFTEQASKAITKIVPYGDLVLSSSLDGSLRLWDFAEKVCTNKLNFPRPVTTFEVISGDRIVIAQEGCFFVCDIGSVKEFSIFGDRSDSNITSAATCGDYLVASFLSGMVKLWDCSNDSEVASLTSGSENSSLTIANAGNIRVGTGGINGTINLWSFPDLIAEKEI